MAPWAEEWSICRRELRREDSLCPCVEKHLESERCLDGDISVGVLAVGLTAGLGPPGLDGVVTTTDIFHTVLDRCDAAGPPAQFAGTDRFVDLFGAKKGRAAVYTEGAGGVRILRTTAFSYYQYREMEKRHYPLPVENGDFLFDLEADPSETINLLEEDPAKAKAILDREFAEALHTHRHLMNGEILPDPMHDADGELAERLRALGYIE